MRKSNQQFIIVALILTIIIVYLFVTAPPPLEDEKTSAQLPVEFILRLANEENKVVRKLYTKEIVQAGNKIGIEFQEDWQEKSVVAGMLPAQFLRETAMYLEKSPVRLGLYLGSDYPINRANLIEGLQATEYIKLKETKSDVFLVCLLKRPLYLCLLILRLLRHVLPVITNMLKHLKIIGT